ICYGYIVDTALQTEIETKELEGGILKQHQGWFV
ncbi:MAG: hypothetical protein RIR48_1532, partial [Bacteroidota bacterium]